MLWVLCSVGCRSYAGYGFVEGVDSITELVYITGNIFKALLVQPGENASLIRMRSLVQIQEGAPVPSFRGVDGTVTVPC